MTNDVVTNKNSENSGNEKKLHFFEKYLTLWVLLCIAAGMVLGKVAPQFAGWLDGLAIYVNQAPVISIPIAICLFFMMYPIMVKIDFAEVLKAGKSIKPVGLTLFVNWAVKPFTMYAISVFFLGTVFYGLIGPDVMDIKLWVDTQTFDLHRILITQEKEDEVEPTLWQIDFWDFDEVVEVLPPVTGE